MSKQTDRTRTSDAFVARILTDKENGLTAKQIQSFHGLTTNQYKYIVYTLGKKLDKNRANFRSTKSAQSEAVTVLSASEASADIWIPTEKTEKEKKSFWKRLVSKIFFWYPKKA